MSAGDLIRDDAWALAFRVLEPAPEHPRRLLVLLHGVGGTERQLVPLGEQVDARTLVVLPRGPRSVGNDMFGWFRVAFEADGPRIVAAEAEESRHALIEFVAQCQARHGVATDSTVIAGFSQGGIMSAGVALTAPGHVGGFAIVAGRILPEVAPHLASPGALAGLSGLIVHGERDDKLPVDWAHRADAWLQRLQVPHAMRLHDAAHAFTPAMQADFLEWFADAHQRWNADPPALGADT